MELPLVVVLFALVLAPPLVDARVDVVPSLLVHEEHLPPISSEPTYTLGRFVTEMLKFQGGKFNLLSHCQEPLVYFINYMGNRITKKLQILDWYSWNISLTIRQRGIELTKTLQFNFERAI